MASFLISSITRSWNGGAMIRLLPATTAFKYVVVVQKFSDSGDSYFKYIPAASNLRFLATNAAEIGQNSVM